MPQLEMQPVHVQSQRQSPTPNRRSVSENVDCRKIQSYIVVWDKLKINDSKIYYTSKDDDNDDNNMNMSEAKTVQKTTSHVYTHTYHVRHHFIQNTWVHGCGGTCIQVTCPSLTEGPLDTKLAIGITILTGCFNFVIIFGIIADGSRSCGFTLSAWGQ